MAVLLHNNHINLAFQSTANGEMHEESGSL